MKNIYKLILVVLVIVIWHAPVVCAQGVDDSKIEHTIKNSYVYKQYLKDDDVSVDSKDGVVTLSGSVAQDSHKSLAQDTAENVAGVKKVDNTIEVKNGGAAANSDGWLGLKIKSALLVSGGVNGFGTHVAVKDGVVTLTGEAKNDAQKKLTTQYVKDIDGVKDVDNQMVVGDEHAQADHNSDAAEQAKEKAQEASDKAKESAEDAKDATDQRDMGEMIDDASITAQVKMALLMHSSTSALSTHVTTQDGRVTVTGKAKSDAEKELVSEVVKDIKGVRSVDNQMDVADSTKS